MHGNLGSSQPNVETFEMKTVKGRCTDILILDILIIVTKIGECNSAPLELQQLIIVKPLFSVSFVGPNRKQRHHTAGINTISAKQRNEEPRCYDN